MSDSLQELATVHYGKSPNAVRVDESAFPIYGTGGQMGFAKEALFDGPLVVVARKGTLGNPTYSELACWVIDTAYAVVVKNTVDTKWLYYNLSNYDLDSLNEATGVPSISRDYLYRISFHSTPLSQQRKIARILTTVDNLIEKTEALIAKYQAIKQGMMHDLFTRGVDSRGHLRPPYEEAPELYKQSELGWIPKEWEVVPLSSVAEVGRGKFTPRPRNDPKYYGGTYPFIQTGDVANSLGRYLSTYTQTLNELGTTVSKGFPAGTIAVTIAANIADTAILGIPMFLPDSIVGVVVHPDTNIRYVELCLRRAKHALDAKAPQSAQKNINLDDLRPLPIPLPQQIEQERTAKLYESNEALLTAEETNLQKLRLQKTGLMQDLLTGKVRVQVDEADEVGHDGGI